jgi:deoxyribodipyrimidine photo-lyase
MQRAQRGVDNPALDVAVHAANELRKPVVVFFAPIPFYPHANLRHYAFLAEGIADIAADLTRRNIGFVLRRWPDHHLAGFCEEVRPVLVVGDDNPLRGPARWREKAAEQIRVPLWTVDADVVVPSKLIEKAQYAARIIRPRLQLQLPAFLQKPENPRARVAWSVLTQFRPNGTGHSPVPTLAVATLAVATLDADISLDELTRGWPLDRSVGPVRSFRGGTREGMRLLREFVRHKLPRYSRDRNHPELDGTSRLSPYLHFGHISPVRLAWEVQQSDAPEAEKKAFLDQMITWRELAVNFVRTNPHYDSLDAAEPWAHRTLDAHARDGRPALYTARELENAETADPLWNAAQRQMVTEGWMHNYMRMYWAKKILEWTPTPREAYELAVHLNDKHFLDGRDPNGYAGVAWAIAGKFDRPWFERPVFGTIRYMSATAAARKFDATSYIRNHTL